MKLETTALQAAVKEMWVEDGFKARGLPEASIEVVAENEALYAVLKARSKERWLFCRLPGLPKEINFLVQTVDEIIRYLIDEAMKLPTIPREQRWVQTSPTTIQPPTEARSQ